MSTLRFILILFIIIFLMLRDLYSIDWFTISVAILCFGFILLRYLDSFKYKYFFLLFLSNTFWKYKRKDNRYITSFEIILFVITHIILAIIFYFLPVNHFSYLLVKVDKVWIDILIYFMGLGSIGVIKFYVEKLINFCFYNDSRVIFYIHCKQIIFSYAVILSLPFLICSVYFTFQKEFFFLLGLAFIGFVYFLKILQFYLHNKNLLTKNWYYFILYLCTLEIAPYFFIYKVVAN